MADTKPGDARELRRYWAKGEGAAKWRTFTELVALLAKYIENPREREGFAAKVYKDRYGVWPGRKRGDK